MSLYETETEQDVFLLERENNHKTWQESKTEKFSNSCNTLHDIMYPTRSTGLYAPQNFSTNWNVTVYNYNSIFTSN